MPIKSFFFIPVPQRLIHKYFLILILQRPFSFMTHKPFIFHVQKSISPSKFTKTFRIPISQRPFPFQFYKYHSHSKFTKSSLIPNSLHEKNVHIVKSVLSNSVTCVEIIHGDTHIKFHQIPKWYYSYDILL